MENPTLEFVLGLKAGIGRTFAQAETAMFQAKELAEKILDSDPLDLAKQKVQEALNSQKYAITLFSENTPLLTPTESSEEEIIRLKVMVNLHRLGEIERKYGLHSLAYDSFVDCLNSFSVDSATNTFTPFGYLRYLIENDLLRYNTRREDHFLVLVDCNSMHYWNSQYGFDTVTQHINFVGNALAATTRKNPRDYSRDLVTLVTRTHGSAGDEFLVDMYCPPENILTAVSSIFNRVYTTQFKALRR